MHHHHVPEQLKSIQEAHEAQEPFELEFDVHAEHSDSEAAGSEPESEPEEQEAKKRGRHHSRASHSSQDDLSFPMDGDGEGEHSPSSRSTTMMQASPAYSQEEATAGTAGLQALPGRSPRRLPVMQPRTTMASSVPVRSSNIKMGSSVPVNIPMGAAMRARGLGGQGAGGPGDPAGEDAAAFIPPHQFSQRDDFTMGSFVPGETPGMAIKRDRLRVRNAILRSTGFLENNPPIPHVVGSIPEKPSYKGLGGLSQAIKAVGSPAS
ncbi:hypothetical protein DUNSADRAFT_11024 [Dunaliella salina]|uniref:Encoded protein n=1 Tax=Dunaliella salina TaxID=3046 RepID=A0ABQ7GE73_DUNSA|nr:hypothetical protein DUNSADRAFT_11024 [Dunaliella salina]|eukprot:KAF5832912.1 hypothetical protein DUNSADRAFT_11024 [Dunaliella salina]